MSDTAKNALDGLAQAMLESVQPLIDARIEREIEAAKAKFGTRKIEVVLPDGGAKKMDGHAHPVFDRVVKNVAAGQNVLLVGPAGCGKTHLAAQVARALSYKFTAYSISEGTTESNLFGRLLPVGENGSFTYCTSPYVSFYEEGGLVLLDEMDRGNANVFTSLNASLAQEYFFSDLRSATGGKGFVRKHEGFRCIAAANTFGEGGSAMYAGANQLDASTLSRFKVIEMDYDTSFEGKIAPERVLNWVWDLRSKVRDHQLRKVVGTRMIQQMALGMQIGESWDEVKESALAGWSKDDRGRCGV